VQTTANEYGADRERLLIVTSELTRGGAAYLALRHARRLCQRYAVDVLVTDRCDDAFLEEFPSNVSIFRAGATARPPGPPGADRDGQFLLRHAQTPPLQRTYRAVLATSVFWDSCACAAACAARASRLLVFLVDEALARYPHLTPPEQNAIALCIRRADLLLPVSRRLWQRMSVCCPPLRGKPWLSLQPPLETEKILEQARLPQSAIVPGEVPTVLTVARLTTDKQLPLCVAVHERLKKTGVRFLWYVIGTGSEEHRLRLEIYRRGLAQDFRLLGHQPNVYACMQACDVLALFSSSEGCPTVVLEALLLGRPVIMTDVNGADELIENGKSGLVVANNADAIATGLARLVQDESLQQRFRNALGRRPAFADAAGILERLLDQSDAIVALPAATVPPKVSILIPTYNQERLVSRAIVSALAQDYPSLEVIVADDASTDGTGRAAQVWERDVRFRYIRNRRNLGRVANYQRLLTELARGDWVLMLDGDDFLADPGFIRRACAALARHAERPIVFAQAGHRVQHLDGTRADADILPPLGEAERILGGGAYLRFVFETGFFTHLGTLYDRRAALRVGFYTAGISASDMDSLFRLAAEGEVLLLNSIAGCWVQHGTNTSSALCLGDLVPNVRIFRRCARAMVRRGLVTWQELRKPLRRYQATTLLTLFGAMVGKTVRGPFAVLRLFAIGCRIDRRLAWDPFFLWSCLGFIWPLTRSALGRLWMWGRGQAPRSFAA
jgi:glycosyltransferase involved in cell wall biosynthesis